MRCFCCLMLCTSLFMSTFCTVVAGVAAAAAAAAAVVAAAAAAPSTRLRRPSPSRCWSPSSLLCSSPASSTVVTGCF